ncbi:MAG: hypothetical protein ABH846_02720 [Patescibacteria group bacterium]
MIRIRNAMLAATTTTLIVSTGCDEYRPWPPVEDHPNIPGTCDETAPFGGEVCAQPMDHMGGALRIRFEPDEANWTELDLGLAWRSVSQTGNQLLTFDQPSVLVPVFYDGANSSGSTFWATMPMAPPDGYVEVEGIIHSEAGFSDQVFCDNDPGGNIQVWFGPYYEVDYTLSHDCKLKITLARLKS